RTIESVGGQVTATPAPEARARAFRTIGAGYFSTLGLKLLDGREFTAAEESSNTGPRVAIVDETLASHLFGSGNPLGHMIRVARGDSAGVVSAETEPMEIVGVAPPI